jgi:hypothetical protein
MCSTPIYIYELCLLVFAVVFVMTKMKSFQLWSTICIIIKPSSHEWHRITPIEPVYRLVSSIILVVCGTSRCQHVRKWEDVRTAAYAFITWTCFTRLVLHAYQNWINHTRCLLDCFTRKKRFELARVDTNNMNEIWITQPFTGRFEDIFGCCEITRLSCQHRFLETFADSKNPWCSIITNSL